MTPEEMKRAWDVHREAEQRRDIPAVVETFDDDCFLDNVALGLRSSGKDAVLANYQSLFTTFPDLTPTDEGIAYGDDTMVTWGTLRGTMEAEWLGIAPTGKSFETQFTNVVPFKNGKMQGEKILLDLADACEQLGIAVEELRSAAQRAGAGR